MTQMKTMEVERMRDETLERLARLDAELTGHALAECRRNSRHYSHYDIFDLASNLYYLSDGGYSRLRITDDYKIALAMGARAEIEFNWLYAEKKIAAVQEMLKIEIKDLDGPRLASRMYSREDNFFAALDHAEDD
jgi:hypothetical protein